MTASTEPLMFLLRGTIADVNGTAVDEPLHPSLVVHVDFGVGIRRVIVPAELAKQHFVRLEVGVPVHVTGHVMGDATLLAAEMSF
jgi:hypothetical protein